MKPPAVNPLLRSIEARYLRWRRSRARSCGRCGAPAEGVCSACRSRVCADCAVLSIETGIPVAICLGCNAGSFPSSGIAGLRTRLVFRRGATLLLLSVACIGAVVLERDGWSGLGKVVLTLLHPYVLLALVPLAFLLGAITSVLVRLFVKGRRTRPPLS